MREPKTNWKKIIQELLRTTAYGFCMAVMVAMMLWVSYAYIVELGFIGGSIASAFIAGGVALYTVDWIFWEVYGTLSHWYWSKEQIEYAKKL